MRARLGSSLKLWQLDELVVDSQAGAHAPHQPSLPLWTLYDPSIRATLTPSFPARTKGAAWPSHRGAIRWKSSVAHRSTCPLMITISLFSVSFKNRGEGHDKTEHFSYFLAWGEKCGGCWAVDSQWQVNWEVVDTARILKYLTNSLLFYLCMCELSGFKQFDQ